MSNFDEMGTFDYQTFNDQQGDGLPRIWWHNGSRDRKVPGSFYTRAEDWAGDLPEPWVADERFEGEAGWAAPVLRILPVVYRSQPFRRVDTGGRVTREYVDKWEPGMSIHTEIVCLADGLDDPVVWSTKGTTGASVTGKGGIFAEARRLLIIPAEKALKKRVPLHAFWLPIGQAMEGGKLKVVQFTQGGHATPPALRLPELEGRDLLNSLYAGRALIERAEALRSEYEAWRLERRGAEPADELAPAPLHTGRNAPQAVDLDEFGPEPGDDEIV